MTVISSGSSSSPCFNPQEHFQQPIASDASTNESVINIDNFPEEVLCKIFSNLDFKTLEDCSLVNKQWNRLTTDPLVLKQAAYNNSFSNAEWVRCFGDQVLAGEENKDDYKDLPPNIVQILKGPCPAFSGKRVFETHILFRMNRTVGLTLEGEKKLLTLNTLGELARRYFPNTENNTGYRYIWGDLATLHGDTPIDKSGWVLMTKELLEGSCYKSFAIQQAMVVGIASDALGNPVYAVPKTLEATLGILTEYFRTTVLGTPEVPAKPGTRLFNDLGEFNGYTRCEEQTRSLWAMARNLVGCFAIDGVRIDDGICDDDLGSVGVVGLRKFWS